MNQSCEITDGTYKGHRGTIISHTEKFTRIDIGDKIIRCKKEFVNHEIQEPTIQEPTIQENQQMKEKKDKRPSIQNEADNGLSNDKYTVAMARTMEPHSASAQFFINVADNAFLNHSGKSLQGWGYAVFGEVVDGMDVVNAIKAVSTTRRGMHADVPAEDVVIERAYLKDAE